MRYWERRARQRRSRLALSRMRSASRDRVDKSRHGANALGRLLVGAAWSGAAAVLAVALLEAAAGALNHHHSAIARLVKPLDSSDYEAFVSAAVGAEAVFLALFFTTVGVIAATAYSNVPGEVRQLFVRERASRTYAYTVVWALVFGILILAGSSVGHKPHAISVVVFAVLVLLSVLSLVRLGTELFNFFDLSSLSRGLPRRFVRAVKAATASPRHVPDEGRQQALHVQGAAVLDLYRQLSVLIVNREGGEAKAPRRLIQQLLGMWTAYGAHKPAIPTSSRWFALTPAHANWLTMDSTRLGAALATRTGIQPTLAPDPLWVEHELAKRLRELLPLVLRGDGWATGIELADMSNGLVDQLASRFHVEEALLLARTTARELNTARASDVSGDISTGRDAPLGDHRATFRTAAVERSAIGLTAAWLGFVRSVKGIDAERFSRALDRAVASATSPYAAAAPRPLLLVLEEVAEGIAFENRTEGHRVTPSWWVHHVGARAFSQVLLRGVKDLLHEVEESVVARAESSELESEPEARTVLVFDGLELAYKVAWGLGEIHQGLQRLATLQNTAAGEDTWPTDDLDDDTPREYERRLLRVLAKTVFKLPSDAHDETRPDLFGQAYKRLYDATFHALLQGDHELARDLFGVVIATADQARARLIMDLAPQAPRQQLVFGTEPLVDLMEISGYALFMQELDHDGIWPDVKARWDAIMSGREAPAIAQQLTVVLDARAQIFALTSGDTERTGRRMALGRLLEDRRVVGRSHYLGPGERTDEPPPTQSPIVTVFAPDGFGYNGNLEDLFVVEYLLGRPQARGATLPRRAEMLRDRITRARERASQNDEPQPPETDAEEGEP
jgi:hypothetical protein